MQHELPRNAEAPSPVTPSNSGALWGSLTQRGVPVPGVTIVARRLVFSDRPFHPPMGTGCWHTETDEFGQFRFLNMPLFQGGLIHCSYLLTAEHEGDAACGRAWISDRHPCNRTHLSLMPSLPISGYVLDEHSAPLQGAWVRPKFTEGSDEWKVHGPHALLGALTDTEGRFTLPPLYEGNWILNVSRPGFAPLETLAQAAGRRDVIVFLERRATVNGTVLHIPGHYPLRGVVVELVDKNGRTTQDPVTSDNKGEFSFENVPDGQYWVQAYDTHYVTYGDPVDVNVESNEACLDLTLEAEVGATVSGALRDETTGRPVAGLDVLAFLEADCTHRPPRSVQTDENGHYRISGLPGGLHRILTQWRQGVLGSALRKSNECLLEPGMVLDDVDFYVHPGVTISGRMVDRDGNPIAGEEIFTATQDDTEHVTSGADGSFVVHGLPLHTRVHFPLQNSPWFEKDLDAVNTGCDGVRDLVIVMERGAVVSGTVVTHDGRPVDGARVQPAPHDENDRFGTDDYTRPSGDFYCWGLPPGNYSIFASVEDDPEERESAEVTITLEPGEVRSGLRLVLGAPGSDPKIDPLATHSISGRVTNRLGEPLEGVQVNAFMVDGASHGENVTDADGHYEITGLSDAAYQFTVFPGGPYLIKTGTKCSPGTHEVNFVLDRFAHVIGNVYDAITGLPLRQFSVKRCREEPGSEYRGSSQGKSFRSDSGEFGMPLWPGNSVLCIRAQGYAPTTILLEDVEEGAELSSIAIHVKRGSVLEGRVTDTIGNPIYNARIYPLDYMEEHEPGIGGTDRDGKFCIDSVGPALSYIHIAHNDYKTLRLDCTLIYGGTTTLNVQLESI